MNDHHLLTKDEFLRCFAEPMCNVTATEGVVVDIWSYVDGLDPANLNITKIGDVAHVYRDGQARYDQVLLYTEFSNTFVVIVVDLTHEAVIGHHLLDLSVEYGVSSKH